MHASRKRVTIILSDIDSYQISELDTSRWDLFSKKDGLDIRTNGGSRSFASMILQVDVAQLQVLAWHSFATCDYDCDLRCGGASNVIELDIAELNTRWSL